MTQSTGLVDRLIGGAVWAVSIADHHADVLTPRQIKQLYDAGNASREAATTIAELVAALTQTQWMLETIDRTNSTNFPEVRERILANRPVLTKSRSAL